MIAWDLVDLEFEIYIRLMIWMQKKTLEKSESKKKKTIPNICFSFKL